MVAPGEQICGHLRLLRYANAGVGNPVFGPAFVAIDDDSGIELRLTIIPREFVSTSIKISEFMAAANGLARLRHPGIARVCLVDREQDYAVVGIESLSGSKSLMSMWGKRATDATVVRRAIELARSLSFLHGRGVVHGLLSMHSVMIWEQNTLLWQYGLAPSCDSDAVKDSARRQGGAQLFAPETLRGEPGTARTDVWGWAMIIAQLASGLDDVSAVSAVQEGELEVFNADPALVGLLRRCLSSDSDARVSGGEALLEELSRAGLLDDRVVPPAGGNPIPVPVAPMATPAPVMPEGDLFFVDDEAEGAELLEVQDVPPDDPMFGLSASLLVDEDDSQVETPAANDRDLISSTAGDSANDMLEEALSDFGLEPDFGLGAHEDTERIDEYSLVDLATAGADSLEPRVEPSVEPRLEPVDGPSGVPLGRLELAAPTQEVPLPTPGLAQAVVEEHFSMPRSPGPHGPPAGVMAGLAALGAFGIVLVAFVSVLQKQGGFEEVVDFRIAGPMLVDGTGRSKGEAPLVETGGNGRQNSGMDAAEAVEVLAQKVVPGDCPPIAIAIDDRYCIDAAEYPEARRIPRTSVTMREAGRACEARGGRLCSRREWQRACGGARGWRLPYGNNTQLSRCNTASIAGFAQEVTAAASLRECVSPDGIYDMVGNVGEWVAEGIAVGGDSHSHPRTTDCNSRGRPPSGFSGPELGFRCCYDR